MKNTIFILLASLIGTPAVAQTIASGQAAPAFEITMLDSTRVNSLDLDGQVILLAFTRTVLPSSPDIACARSIGLLTLIGKELIPRFSREEELTILPVIMHYRSRQEVIRFRDKYKFDFPLGLDVNKKIASRFTPDATPRLFLIDRAGKIAELPTTREFTGEERAA
ncbi:MAG: TlpA family protein disulfide reductase, partial [Odoribacteraceae bacterium]|nr:TlpA family protein disulfide reductase [Odoribacteraceae bacterium]